MASLKGYNYVLLALGSKGSGKTHHLVGGTKWYRDVFSDLQRKEEALLPLKQDEDQASGGEDHGIIPRAICDLFAMIGLLKQED
jgi:hypothetical protein